MSIWKNDYALSHAKEHRKVTIMGVLGIELTERGDDYLSATMPVDERTRQPMGILHGGASVVLAETLGSSAAGMCLDLSKEYCVGLDINANHIRAIRSGTVTGVAKPLHIGRSTHVWEINIVDEKQRLVCISRLTMAILQREEARS
jgi:1,4-dihydroxy-2-naphthoyl-CoA hydrolase